jgi:hypothetical protein
MSNARVIPSLNFEEINRYSSTFKPCCLFSVNPFYMQIELGFVSIDMGKNATVFLLLAISLFVGASSCFISLQGLDSVYGISKGIILKDPASFFDSNGKLNIVGVIDNNGEFPVGAIVGVNVSRATHNESSAFADISSNGSNNSFVSTFTSPTYSRIIYPGTGAPFKLVLSPESIESVGQPFIYSITREENVNYDVLVLNYSNMAVGSEGALIGTVRNSASFPVYNATVFASVHDSHQAQIDSAATEVIPVIGPGKTVQFKLAPDKSQSSKAVYYSCAGVDLDAPISTLATPDGGFIPFDLQAIAKIINLKYDDQSKSILFGVDHYNPDGGLITLKLPQLYDDQRLTVFMDGLARDDVKMTHDGKTIKMDIFVPPNEHQIQVKGVSYVT